MPGACAKSACVSGNQLASRVAVLLSFPTLTDATFSGLEASRARQQSRNNAGEGNSSNKPHRGPIITRYPVPPDSVAGMSQYGPRHPHPYPHGPSPPGYPPFAPGYEVPAYPPPPTPYDPYRAPGVPAPPGLPGPAQSYPTPPFGQAPPPYNSSYNYPGFSGPAGAPGVPGPPHHLPPPGPPGPPPPPVHQYPGPHQQFSPPPTFQQPTPPSYGYPPPISGYSEHYYQSSQTAPPPHPNHSPPGEGPVNHHYGGGDGQHQYGYDYYGRPQDSRAADQPWNQHLPVNVPYGSNGHQSKAHRYRDDRLNGQNERKGRRFQNNRHDQRPKNERYHRPYDRKRDFHRHPQPGDPHYGDQESAPASPRSRASAKEGHVSEVIPHDDRAGEDDHETAANADDDDDDMDWEEKAIFGDSSPKTSEVPLAKPLSDEWVDEVNPTLSVAVEVESKYITPSNVDDFSQSVRDTKEWFFMRYHPAMLEPGDAHSYMITKYTTALGSWRHSHQHGGKKGHGSRWHKGKNESARHYGKQHDTNGYINNLPDNGLYHNRPLGQERSRDFRDTTPHRLDGLPVPLNTHKSPGSYSPHYSSKTSSGSRVTGQQGRNNTRFGQQPRHYREWDYERDYRPSPDTHRKRRWAESQDQFGSSRTQPSYSGASYGAPGREDNNKRSKYVSPEPGEIADDSDYPYDRRSDSLAPSRYESRSGDHTDFRNRDKGHYSSHTPRELHEIKPDVGRTMAPAISVDSSASGPESGEVVDSDSYSPRDDSQSPGRTLGFGTHHTAQKSPQIEKSSDKLSVNTASRDGYDRNAPNSRPSSRRSSRSNSVGSQPNSGRNSRRSSSGDLEPPDSPLTPTELALLGMDNDLTDESDPGRPSPKRRPEATPLRSKKRRAKVHEAYR